VGENNNWVERRAKREGVLDGKAEELWDQIRAALQDACDSYNEHYGYDPNKPKVSCRLENSRRALITRTRPVDHMTRFREERIRIIVEFDKEGPTVTATRDTTSPQNFTISSDESEVFVMIARERISPDELSRRILEPLLFDGNERRHPIFKAQS
jgi:hypothetical protein